MDATLFRPLDETEPKPSEDRGEYSILISEIYHILYVHSPDWSLQFLIVASDFTSDHNDSKPACVPERS